LQYQRILLDIQNFIYDEYFVKIYNDLRTKGQFNLEDCLAALNKLTINKLEVYIHQDIEQQQYQDQNRQAETYPTNTTNTTNTINTGTGITGQSSIKQLDDPYIQQLDDPYIEKVVNKYHHFFSSDGGLECGRYSFPFSLKRVTSVQLEHLRLNCNLYNITEANNKFYITETDSKVCFKLPIGYYQIDNLLLVMTNILNNQSQNKLTYTISKNETKNKVYIQCTKASEPCTFNLHFESSKLKNPHVSLKDLLGFKKDEYLNNNLYVSESFPIDNSLDDYYVKLFINDKEVTRFYTTKQSFTYFDSFNINFATYFGKCYHTTVQMLEPFDFQDDLQVDTVSIELWNGPHHLLTRFTEFDFVLAFEHLM
jgi:hypothetical protein